MIKLVIQIQCPFCSAMMNTSTVKTVRCFTCNKSFEIYPKNQRSRIVGIVNGDVQLLLRVWYKEFGKERMKRKGI